MANTYTTRPLSPETWDDFCALVEANNGVWGGCWCIGFHVEGFGKDPSPERNRAAKRAHVDRGTVHQILVYTSDGDCVGWCQYGTPAELPNIKNAAKYAAGTTELPAWRIGCIFTGSRHRGRGVAVRLSEARWTRSRPPAAEWWRLIRNRPPTARRSAAPTCTPARKSSTNSSGSCVTARSPSGDGSCARKSDDCPASEADRNAAPTVTGQATRLPNWRGWR